MRSTLARSVAAMAAGAALVLVPMSASAETIDNPLLGVEDPTTIESLPNEPEYNNEDNWTQWLLEVDVPGAMCTKYDPADTPFIVPDYPSDTEDWLLAIVKSGSDQSTDSPNDLYWFPLPDEELFHSSEREISHVILCSMEFTDEETPTTPVTSTTTTGTSTTTTGTSTTTTGTTTTPVTGPVVETDRPAGGDMSQVGLFAGAAALLAGATALVLGRRRQSAEH